jgi:uridylate kinase
MARQLDTKLKRVVIKLSGSIFKEDIEESDLKPFIEYLSEIRRSGVKMVLVAGGGKAARQYISTARKIGADESFLDEIGILVSRLNAMTLLGGFSLLAYSSIPTSLTEIARAFEEKGLVVTGGLHPGQSTNATTSLIAERVKADLILNCTSVDGVYTKDPKKNKDAKKLSKVSINQLREILSNSSMDAGTYELMDSIALKIIERSRIKTIITLCSPESIKQVFERRDIGTIIISD